MKPLNKEREEKMRKKTMQRITFGITLLLLGCVGGMVVSSYSTAYDKPDYELISFDLKTTDLTGDPQRRAKQLVDRLEAVEEQLETMSAKGWELHSFWGNVAVFER